MIAVVLSPGQWAREGVFAALVVAGTMPSAAIAQRSAPQPDLDPAARRSVQAVELQSTGADGQTSWMIEPDVPRIPKIVGSNLNLSPHIERRLSYAFDLAQRGATYSADGEFRAVLGLCALELDASEGGTRRREALCQGLAALDEADDFGGDQMDWRNSTDVRSAATCHTTPVLKQGANSPVDAMNAVQAYYGYAEKRLAYGCEGMPGASLAYYGLARTLVVPGTQVPHAAGKAALLQRVALTIEPKNVLAGNELGVLLAQHGRLDDAEKLFQQCVATDATPETWKNLAIIYSQKGDQTASHSAMAASEALVVEKARKAARNTGSAAGNQAPAQSGETNETKQKPGFLARFNEATPKFSNPFRR